MDFKLSDEQKLLKDAVGGYLASSYDLVESRRAARLGDGWQPETWRAFAEDLGILGASLPDSVGGAGGGAEEVFVIAQELGYHLVVEPYTGTVVLGASILEGAGTDSATAVLAEIVEGAAITALAALEPTSGQSYQSISTTATRDGDDWIINGDKIVVADGPIATHLIITARTSGDTSSEDGITLFAIPFDPKDPPNGVTAQHYRTIDDRHASDLTFTGLHVPDAARVGDVDGGWPILDAAIDAATAATIAEAVGAMRKVLADTVEYTKQRQQFGVPISSFQALQHRMVNMYIELQQATAAAYLATLNLDGPKRRRAVSAAKTTVARAARLVGQEAVQLHGGMGMTEELAIGHYFKRLTAIESEFGGRDFHTRRYQQEWTPASV